MAASDTVVKRAHRMAHGVSFPCVNAEVFTPQSLISDPIPEVREPRQLAPRIESDPGILGGKPVIQGSRLSVATLLEQMAGGYTLDDLLDAYPFLTANDVSAPLTYADG